MPDNSPPPTPAQILKKIEDGSQRVNQLATELSQRIIEFEDWLNQLPGKVHTTLWLPLPRDADGPRKFGLCLSRSGKRWSLSYGHTGGFRTQSWGRGVENQSDAYTSGDDSDIKIDWNPLSDASVENKLFAVKHFPQLLAKVTEEQDRLAKKLQNAHGEFDAFAHAIGLTQRKEGK